MIFTDLVHTLFRAAELVFAAIVAGITGHYLHVADNNQSSWQLARFIYTEVVAALSILFSLLWLLPFASSFIHWPVDLLLSACWFAAFGLLVDYLGDSCGHTFDWSGIGLRGVNCGSWKADEAFAFLSAICWLVSALLGLFWVREKQRRAAEYHSRRRWYRRGPRV